MNIITYQLTPLAYLLQSEPTPKEDFIKKVKETSVNKGIVSLLEMMEFSEIYKKGNDIVLQ